MELRLLRYFLAVVDEGSVSRAALAVRVAQPSLSRQLRQLEAAVGVALFERVPRGLRLTPAGAVFLPMARDLVTRADAAAATMAGLRDKRSVPITLVAPETTVADVIAPFLAARSRETAVVNVREALPSAIFEEVRAGTADVGVSSGSVPVELAVRPIAAFPIWAYVPSGHRWATRTRVTVRQLIREPLVVLGPQHGTRRLLDAAVAAAGGRYVTAVETNVPQVAQALAAGGRGVAVVSDDPRYGLHPLAIQTPGGPLRIPLFAAWDPLHYAAEAIEQLVDVLAAYASERYGSAGEGR